MSMSKKDYEAIAEAMVDSRPTASVVEFVDENGRSYLHDGHRDASYFEAMSVWRYTLMNLCAVFEKDNERFDRSKFLKACGLNEKDWW